MAKYKGIPKVKINSDGVLDRADNLGFLTIRSLSPKFHFIIDKKNSKILVISNTYGYLKLSKEQAMTIADELYVFARDELQGE